MSMMACTCPSIQVSWGARKYKSEDFFFATKVPQENKSAKARKLDNGERGNAQAPRISCKICNFQH